MLKKSKTRAVEPSSLRRQKPAKAAPPRNAAVEQDFLYDQDDAAETDADEDTARYLADMIASLAMIARQAKLDLLTYLLDMARVEAEMQARQSDTPFDED
jgi:hypothetical protein